MSDVSREEFDRFIARVEGHFRLDHDNWNGIDRIVMQRVELFSKAHVPEMVREELKAHAKPNGAVHVKADSDSLSWTWATRIIGGAVAGSAFTIWMLHLMGKV